MKIVPAGIQIRQHFDDGAIASLHGQEDGQLHTNKTSAQDNNFLSCFLRMIIDLLRSENIWSIYTRNLWFYWPCTKRCKNHIRRDLFCQFRRYFCIQTHFDFSVLFDQVFLKFNVTVQFLFKRNFFLTAQYAAESITLFTQDDLMSSFAGFQSCLHSCHAAANDKHFFQDFWKCDLIIGYFKFMTGLRIDRAVDDIGVHMF